MRPLLPVCVCCLAVALLPGPADAQQKPPRVSPPVGEYGDPAKLVIEGAETIPADIVKRGLLSDTEVLLAAHRFAPLDEYPHTLRRRATDGYQREGFPDARVSVVVDEPNERIVMTVVEGPRFLCEGIRVEGANPLDTSKLIERLTQPHPPAGAALLDFGGGIKRWRAANGKLTKFEAAVWKRGDPAPFGSPYQFTITRQVREAFADLGYETVEFSARVVPHRDTQTAELQITVAELGAPTIVESIEVTGCEKNSQDAVLEYLALKPGQPYVPNLRTRVAHALWRSGRFLKSDVAESRGAGGAVRLKIALTEYAHAPPLDAEFNEYEQILLRCRDWLSNLEGAGYDLVIDELLDTGTEGQKVRLQVGAVMSGQSGAIVTASTLAEAEAQPTSALPAYAVVLSKERMAVYSTARGVKLSTKPIDGYFHLEFTHELTDDPEGERPTIFGFNVGVGDTRHDRSAPPFEFSLRLAPVAFVAMAHMWQPEFTLDDDLLTLRTREGEARIEVETGRLIEYHRKQKTGERTHVRTERRAFDRRLAELEQATASLRNQFDDKRPVTSLTSFLLEDPLLPTVMQELDRANQNEAKPWRTMLERWRRLAPVAARLVARDALAPLDAVVVAKQNERPARFRVPTYGPPPGGGGTGAAVGYFALQMSDQLLPRDSWAWTVWRETALNMSSQGKYTQHELRRIHEAPDTGPLCHLTIASMFDAIHSPLARHFAEHGLERLTLVDFQNDYRPLLNREYVAGACLLKTAAVARELTDEEAESVGKALFGEDAQYFVEAARILRERRDEPIEDVLPDALDALWERGLLPRVSAALSDIQRR